MSFSHTSKKNFNSIDLGKIIAATLVVGIHCNPFRGLANDIIIEGFARLAVPFFFIVSSFLFFRKSPKGSNLIHFLKRILILYLFWAIFNLPQCYLYRWPSSIGELLHRFFLGSTFGASWFLMALMEATSIIWLLGKRLSNSILFAISLLLYLPTLFPEWTNNNCTGFFYYIKGGWMSALIFIILGKILAESRLSENSIGGGNPTLLLIFMSGVLANSILLKGQSYFYVIQGILLIPTAYLCVEFLLQHECLKKLPYKDFRKMSTVFYLSHFTFISLVSFPLHHILKVQWPIVRYLLVLLCCFILFMIINTLQKKKYFHWLKYAF